MFIMFDTDWEKLDQSGGFWRMMEDGGQLNFVYQLPRCKGDTETHYVIPRALQMGRKNSPAYFCNATEPTRSLLGGLLALTM